MPIKLTVLRGKELEPYLEREFDQFEIKIGRDETNHIPLEDKKKVVSREHAIIRFEDGVYYLNDKGSRNGTFMNNNRLKPDYPYTLDDQSEFVLGEYTVKISITEPKEEKYEETVFLTNPFQDDAETLLNILRSIDEKYQNENPYLRDDLIKQAFGDEILKITGSDFLKAFDEKEDSTKSVQAISSDIPKDDTLFDILINLVVKLSQVISKFRTEFVGATLVQTKDSVQTQSKDSLKNFLLDPAIPEEERNRRASVLNEEIEKVIIHQVALLDGYRASIQEGVSTLLKEINPAIIKKELMKENFEIGPVKIPKNLIPLYIDLKAMKKLELLLFNLSQEDRGVLEKKYFRSGFIGRYLETVSSYQKKSHNADDF